MAAAGIRPVDERCVRRILACKSVRRKELRQDKLTVSYALSPNLAMMGSSPTLLSNKDPTARDAN